ncbi:hypothetical protein MUK70_20600 [Dyadobacter chenwenxiniae]|uniref:Bro-N domain-containing protein n=1 Tax=Dyadobacter chenwenxiniae TaxID=2906456 RepID=A0A9X1PNB5_9BACT|nr:hypothetical protein [Dyadobacter chenwenxiniae]MCF0061641.1 hypothetical protein [Dyadobacter chenwenxiniae]UON81462.1 hypothetical protein MUK70_20600 [Dyadobacter chenwenxiniae]
MERRIKMFDQKKIRSHGDSDLEKWFFAITDIVGILTDSPNPRKYWSVLKGRLKKEGSQLTTVCSQLKLIATDGKSYLTDVADTEQMLRLIQSKLPATFDESKEIAHTGGSIAGNTRKQIEAKTGKKIVSRDNAKILANVRKPDELQ